MKLTSLSQGKGFHYPPCQLLDISGFRILFDCPLDLSALPVFSPIPLGHTASKETLDFFIRAQPRYRTVKQLCLLWNIDVVLVSSPMGFLGLPFLTRNKAFSAQVYATEATARVGQLMMEDLVSMNMEYMQFYGPEESGFPQWMKWEELEKLPRALKEIVLGSDGEKLGSWMTLYSAADIKDCMQKVQALKFGEETCYNGTLLIKALSSGLEIGACNWSISSPKGIVANLSSSCLASSTAMEFDYRALEENDMIIYSDFSTWNSGNNIDDDISCSTSATVSLSGSSDKDISREANAEVLLNQDEGTEEMEKLAFICSCSIDSIKAGGSALIPIGRLGIILQLLELMSVSLESSNMKIPIYFISSVAKELLAFSNIIPEWLCKQRQEKMYSGHPLFDHVELLKDKRLQLFDSVYALELLRSWQEPCIVFCPHWSLRLGPAVHLLRRWCRDPKSLLVMETGDHADLALSPFNPVAMNVLQCSFLDGIRLRKVQPLLSILQPKFVTFPENSRHLIPALDSAISIMYFSVNETLCIPNLKGNSELDIATDLSLQLHWTNLKHKGVSIARLKGQLFMEHGKHRIRPANEEVMSIQTKSLLLWGKPDMEHLLNSLQQVGIKGSLEQGIEDSGSRSSVIVHILEPKKALIEVKATKTIITTADEDLASLLSEAICNNLDSI